MRFFDFSSWQNMLLTLLGLAFFTLISMGIRLLMMFTIQQRRERANRQINERLKTLIAAYKTLGGSFTGTLSVDPIHMRDIRRALEEKAKASELGEQDDGNDGFLGSERSRRIRDNVEAALSDIILLGTEEQVRLAAIASNQLVAGERVQLNELVVLLRDFIRHALDLGPVPADITIPTQGPLRPSVSGGRASSGAGGNRGGGGMGAGGGGVGMGMGLSASSRQSDDIAS
ncbi:hypothetical protein [Alcaligenes faecalis]|uniref:hypothetical protein n=1 Tax=Alcaligenes faecalis TaxID=511 RepID=UPI001C9AB2D9|nr:hypothetical protein [Alcaligenes faecalis]MBY6310434.1 hypothetical protein [Alcaligenes faecalis]MBY6315919.1 hypothetical protein [Alcaligenes faecalis]MBY6390874.1 hypothetical protein [Alcaligenes faecalis]